jgi:UDP-N-acetyl-D-glucosamine dehydrogenase
MREHKFDLDSVELTPQALASYDAVVLLTDHSKFDYAMILEHADLIVDTRGKFRTASPKVVKA